MDQSEVSKLQQYLQKKFANQNINIVPRKEVSDSVEVHLGDEFIGVIYKDIDEGEISYDFNMAILDVDLSAA